MTVRIAVPADVEALAEVAAVTFPLACPPHTSQQTIERHIAGALSPRVFAAHLVDPRRVLLVADGVLGEPFDGYAMVVLQEPDDPDVAAAIRIHPASELSKCYVRESAHGGGVAQSLMAAALSAARDTGAVGMWVATHRDNSRALRFYGKSGFERVGTKLFDLGGTIEHDVVLERSLR